MIRSSRAWIVVAAMVAIAAPLYWAVSPLFIDRRVSEPTPIDISSGAARLLRTGRMVGLDHIHFGAGEVQVFKTTAGTVVRFADDFHIANGPDLFVALGRDGSYRPEARFAPLKGNVGAQHYLLPAALRLEDYNEVWIWCRTFLRPFARAVLTPPQ